MSCFPKINACTPVYADELNYMYDPYDIKASMLENAVNVAKLQYCYSLTDVTHDYMVVDVMTDSTGRFDTVCTADTTSTYCGSALTGYYSGCGTVIRTVSIIYTQNILTTYLKTDHTGAGSIAYNVYDASTDCQIGTALTPNQTHTLDSPTQCAYYEIIQCSDGVSCIKSYAILAGGE
jgi:hypothetical protein